MSLIAYIPATVPQTFVFQCTRGGSTPATLPTLLPPPELLDTKYHIWSLFVPLRARSKPSPCYWHCYLGKQPGTSSVIDKKSRSARATPLLHSSAACENTWRTHPLPVSVCRKGGCSAEFPSLPPRWTNNARQPAVTPSTEHRAGYSRDVYNQSFPLLPHRENDGFPWYPSAVPFGYLYL